MVSDNTTADYKQIEDAFVSDLKKLNKERASARSSTSGDTKEISSGTHLTSAHAGEKEDSSNTDSNGATSEKEPEKQIKIMATYHIPEGFGSKDVRVLEEIVEATKERTRGKLRKKFRTLADSSGVIRRFIETNKMLSPLTVLRANTVF